MTATTAAERGYRSKTITTWLALLTGPLGLHRFYLHGLGDVAGWLFALATFPGVLGVQRIEQFGQDDRLAWALIPLLGLSISAAMASAIFHGLTPDEKWDARHNPGHPVVATGWGPVLAVVPALLVGGAVLTGTIAYGGQKFFEWQLQAEAQAGG